MGGEILGARASRLVTGVAPLGDCRFEIEIAGPLVPGWAGNLAAALARRGIGVERGHAIGSGAGIWSGRFEVHAPGAIDMGVLDLAALVGEEADAGFLTALVLDHFALESVLENRGALHLRVAAPDRIGFLAALLRRCAYFALFPIELRLETQDARIADEFWLRAGADRAPSRATAEALRHALRALVA